MEKKGEGRQVGEMQGDRGREGDGEEEEEKEGRGEGANVI